MSTYILTQGTRHHGPGGQVQKGQGAVHDDGEGDGD